MGACTQCKGDNCSGCTGKYDITIKRKGLKVGTRKGDCHCPHGRGIDVPVSEVDTIYG